MTRRGLLLTVLGALAGGLAFPKPAGAYQAEFKRNLTWAIGFIDRAIDNPEILDSIPNGATIHPPLADLFVTYGAEVSGAQRSRCLCCTGGTGGVVRDDLCDTYRADFDKDMEGFARAIGLPVEQARSIVGCTIVQLGSAANSGLAVRAEVSALKGLESLHESLRRNVGHELTTAVTVPIVSAGKTIVARGVGFEHAFVRTREAA